jgi:hypothetical protein
LNLGLALWYIRAWINAVLHLARFWIDAICINQNDDIEKGHQVNNMRRIYSNATDVWAWLLLLRDKTDLALDLLNEALQFSAGDQSGQSRWSRISST